MVQHVRGYRPLPAQRPGDLARWRVTRTTGVPPVPVNPDARRRPKRAPCTVTYLV